MPDTPIKNKLFICLAAIFFLSGTWSGTAKVSFAAVKQTQPASQTGNSANAAPDTLHTYTVHQGRQGRWDGAWISASPDQLGFNPDFLAKTVQKIGRMKGVYGVLVARNHFLAAEQYFREGSRNKPHNLKSSTKSVMSALIGIAIEKNLLRLDQPISDFLPIVKELPDHRKRDISVRHLLTMTSGLEQTSYQAYNSLVADGNWVRAIMEHKLVADPGVKHQYSTGDSHILSAVLTAATGMSTKEFAVRNLFAPMGVKVRGWEIDPQGFHQGGNNLSLLPRDMVKFGQLYLDNGMFNNRQLVPDWWVDASTRPNYLGQHDVYGHYGYLWYCRPGGEDAFVAVGYGGQYIFVSRKHQCIVVITSTLESKGTDWEKKLFDFIHNGILGSIGPGGRQKQKLPQLKPRRVKRRPNDNTIVLPNSGGPHMGLTVAHVKLRKGPGKTYPALTMLEAGSVLEIDKQVSAWLHVRKKNKRGWVSAQYVRIPKTITLAQQTPVATAQVEKQEATGGLPDQSEKIEKLQKLIVDLKSILNRSKKEKIKLNDDLSTSLKDQDKQRQAVTSSETAQKTLQSELAEAQARISKLDDTLKSGQKTASANIKSLQKAVENQVRATSQSESVKAALESQLTDLSSRLTIQKASAKNIKTARDTLKTKLVSLQEEMEQQEKSFNKELTDAREKISALRKTHSSALNQKTKKLQQIASELKFKQATIAKQNEILKTMQDERQEDSARLAKLQTKFEELQRIVSQTNAAKNDLEAELAKNQKLAANQDATLTSIQAARDDLKAIVMQLQQKSAEQNKSITQAKSTEESLQAELADTREKISELRKAHSVDSDLVAQKQQQIASELKYKQATIAEQSEILKTMHAERQDDSARLAKLQTEFEELQRIVSQTKAAKNDQEAELAKLQTHTASQDAALQSIQTARDDLKAESTLLQQKSAEKNINIKQLELTEKTLQKELAAAREKITELLKTHSVASDLTAQKQQQITSQLESKHAIIAEQNEKYKTLQAEHQNNSARLTELKSELKAKQIITSQVKSAKNELETELAKIQALAASQGSTLQSVQTTRDDLKAQLALLQQRSAEQNKIIEQSKSTHKSIQAELAAARKQISELQISQKETEEQTAKTGKKVSQKLIAEQEIIQTLKKSQHDLQAQQLKTKTNLNKIQGELKRQLRANLQVETANKDLESELTRVRTLLETREAALKTAQTEQANLNDKLASLHKKMADQSKTINQSHLAKQLLKTELTAASSKIIKLRKANSVIIETASKKEKLLTLELESKQEDTAWLKKELQIRPASRQQISKKSAQLQKEPETKQKQTQRIETAAASIAPKSAAVVSQAPGLNTIDAFIRTWALAWEQKKIKDYLGHYSHKFRPTGGISMAAWQLKRRKRLSKPAFIKIEVDNIKKEITGPAQARATFNQKYQSSNYSDRVVKILDLERHNGEWKIEKETSKALSAL